MGNSILGIGQIAIPVKNRDRAKSFYQDQLGLTHLFTAGDLVFFKCGETRILLTLDQTSRSSILYFNVEDIHKAFDNMKNNQVEFIQMPHLVAKMGNVETWMAFFNDSEENTLAIMSEFQSKS
ncbi:MAG: VOC family protein [Firmicutes bacterium]|nr:VOC family protein [Bacillota bacterium]